MGTWTLYKIHPMQILHICLLFLYTGQSTKYLPTKRNYIVSLGKNKLTDDQSKNNKFLLQMKDGNTVKKSDGYDGKKSGDYNNMGPYEYTYKDFESLFDQYSFQSEANTKLAQQNRYVEQSDTQTEKQIDASLEEQTESQENKGKQSNAHYGERSK